MVGRQKVVSGWGELGSKWNGERKGGMEMNQAGRGWDRWSSDPLDSELHIGLSQVHAGKIVGSDFRNPIVGFGFSPGESYAQSDLKMLPFHAPPFS